MAKDNNLQDLLTDIADAIREKKGTTEKINAQNFSAEIASIETGGGAVVAASANDVNFRDYDGTILHSYTKDEFLALSALPNLPTREGLICQEWNWSFEDAQEYVAEYGRLEVGATYITDDGKTRLYIRIAEIGRMDVPLYFSQTVANGVTIDWGDGSATETLSGTGNVNTLHTYAKVGDYTISLNPSSGCTLGLGRKENTYCVMGSTAGNGRVYLNMLQSVEIGQGVTRINKSAFNRCHSLKSVVIPQGVTRIDENAFNYCFSLESVVFPRGVISIDYYAFNYCYSLESVVFPRGIISISFLFYDCSSLSSVVIPRGVTKMEDEAFRNCFSLASVVIPNSVTNIGNYTFYNCYSLASVVIPNGVTSITGNAFGGCSSVAFYDFRTHTSVPTLAATNAFNSIPSDCKIVVPNKLYSEWISATNWSTYASQIFKASDVFPSDEPEDEGVIEYHFEIPMEDDITGGLSGYVEGDYSAIVDKLVSLCAQYGGELPSDVVAEKINITINDDKVVYCTAWLEGREITLGTDAPTSMMSGAAEANLAETYISYERGN